jgi:FAD-linked oxidoreductase
MALLTAPRSLLASGNTINWQNWGGNLSSQPKDILAPRSEDEVIQLMRESRGGIRPFGSGHSWSGLLPTTERMMTLDLLNGLISHDPETRQAEVWGGTKLFVLGPLLDGIDQALINMSDVNYQTLAGAIATSTHGTGAELGSMSSYVVGLRLVTPGGDVIDCSADRDGDLFNAARTSLGSLGVVTRLRIQNRERHRLHQREWLVDTEELLEDMEPLIRDNQQFELFPVPNSDRTIVVVTNEAHPDAEDFIEDEPYAVNTLRDAFNLTRKLPVGRDWAYNTALDLDMGSGINRIGNSHEVLVHPRVVRFMEMEYTVPAEMGADCLREILATIRQHAPHVCFPLEHRYIKGDDTLIGMFSERDGCAISIHQFVDEGDWEGYFRLIEPIFHKYQGRPHWGKWHSLGDRGLARVYPRWEEFKRIRRELDPTGRMLNTHLREVFGET